MTRKMLTASIAVIALLFSVLALNTQSATAQGAPTCPYSAAIAGNVCADALAYPGPFTNVPAVPGAVYGWGGLSVAAAVPGADGAAAGTGGGGGLAVTGSEATVLGYVGTGLIAFGAVSLGSRRRFFQGALD